MSHELLVDSISVLKVSPVSPLQAILAMKRIEVVARLLMTSILSTSPRVQVCQGTLIFTSSNKSFTRLEVKQPQPVALSY